MPPKRDVNKKPSKNSRRSPSPDSRSSTRSPSPYEPPRTRSQTCAMQAAAARARADAGLPPLPTPSKKAGKFFLDPSPPKGVRRIVKKVREALSCSKTKSKSKNSRTTTRGRGRPAKKTGNKKKPVVKQQPQVRRASPTPSPARSPSPDANEDSDDDRYEHSPRTRTPPPAARRSTSNVRSNDSRRGRSRSPIASPSPVSRRRSAHSTRNANSNSYRPLEHGPQFREQWETNVSGAFSERFRRQGRVPVDVTQPSSSSRRSHRSRRSRHEEQRTQEEDEDSGSDVNQPSTSRGQGSTRRRLLRSLLWIQQIDKSTNRFFRLAIPETKVAPVTSQVDDSTQRGRILRIRSQLQKHVLENMPFNFQVIHRFPLMAF
ncbi:unnamed protein product [Caenorhabditis angaria]|uniref:Uncharacterized protein n=1 Tax=Caenorhabditis angaria TaxID=860376 RepID=A0A9P1J4G1_9PELO|nr:unnamed protein product [Caenorhabditis angaria]